MFFYWSLGSSNCPQMSRILLSILADFNIVVRMGSTCHLISKSTSLLTKPLGIVPSALITIGIHVTFVCYSFFSSPAKPRYLSLVSLSFIFTQMSDRTAKFTKQLAFFSFLFFSWLSQGMVVWLRLGDPFLSQNPRYFYASHSPGQILGCAYTTST